MLTDTKQIFFCVTFLLCFTVFHIITDIEKKMHFPIIEFEYICGELWSIFPFILLFVKIGHSASGGKRLVVCEGHHTVIGIHCGGQGAGGRGRRGQERL